MDPIHLAAYDGDVAAVDRLVAEDGERVNAQLEEYLLNAGMPDLEEYGTHGCTSIMFAAFKGHDAVVARLLALGADWRVPLSQTCYQSPHWACIGDHPSVLALLLDAGASVSEPSRFRMTPLTTAVAHKSVECIKLLLARGGGALDLNAEQVLHQAAAQGHAAMVQLFLEAGADPTTRNNIGLTPLQFVRFAGRNYPWVIALLEAATTAPQRPRSLLKTRVLLDAPPTVRKVFNDTRDKGLEWDEHQRAVLAAVPAYLRERVVWGRALPRVEVEKGEGMDEVVVACAEYAVEGMVWGAFVELCEMLVPEWDRKNVR